MNLLSWLSPVYESPHKFMHLAVVKPVADGNVVYLPNAVEKLFCVSCRETKILLNRKLKREEKFGCPGSEFKKAA